MKSTRESLAVATAACSGRTQDECRAAIKAFFAVLMSRLAMDRTIEIHGFGTFRTLHTGAHPGRNPRTGAAMTIPAQSTVKMRFRKGYLDA